MSKDQRVFLHNLCKHVSEKKITQLYNFNKVFLK